MGFCQWITKKMVEKRRYGLYVVFTVIFCGAKVFVWYNAGILFDPGAGVLH